MTLASGVEGVVNGCDQAARLALCALAAALSSSVMAPGPDSLEASTPSGWWMPLKRVVLPERSPLKNLRMSRGAHLYRRFSVDRSTDLANLDEAFEKIQERRARRESQLITMLLIAIAAVCAAVVAALR